MRIIGQHITAKFPEGAPLDEGVTERAYLSFASNFSIVSVDMAADFEERTISFLFGVDVPELVDDAEEFVHGVIDDAFQKAFGIDDGAPSMNSGALEPFAA